MDSNNKMLVGLAPKSKMIVFIFSLMFLSNFVFCFQSSSNKHNAHMMLRRPAIAAPWRNTQPLISTHTLKASLNDKMDEDDWELESKVAELEMHLRRAVKAERYSAAKNIRNKLTSIHLDEMNAILRLNKEFYNAFLNKDADKMKRIWMDSDDVMCIHPNQEVEGYANVVEAWRKAFLGDKAERRAVRLSDVQVHVHGTTGWVTATEEMVGDTGKKKNVQVGSTLHATNLYQRAAGRWYLVHRHATKDAAGEAAAAQQGGGGGGALGQSLQEFMQGRGIAGGGQPMIIRVQGNAAGGGPDGGGAPDLGALIDKIQGALGGGGGGGGRRGTGSDNSSEDEDDDLNIIDLRGMGQEGADIMVEGTQFMEVIDEEEDDDGMSVTVQLKGPEGGFGSDLDEDDPETDRRIRRLRAAMDADQSKTPVARALLARAEADVKRRRQMAQDYDDDDDDSSDDDGDSDEDEYDISSTSIPISQTDRRALQTRTIAAVRRLHDQERITQEEKRVLLSAVIRSAALAEPSTLETACELLLGEDEDWRHEGFVEEFADQCRALAATLGLEEGGGSGGGVGGGAGGQGGGEAPGEV